jgi:hypothetical protein
MSNLEDRIRKEQQEASPNICLGKNNPQAILADYLRARELHHTEALARILATLQRASPLGNSVRVCPGRLFLF